MKGRELEFYKSQPVAEESVRELIETEINRAPSAPGELIHRIEGHNSCSPRDSGGDIDASWEEVNTSGAESVFGHNPTPDQSDVEMNAHAMGINFEDSEALDFESNITARDTNRYELMENSKSEDDTI